MSYQAIRDELNACRRVLAGETVNGVKIGDAGITREWVQQTEQNLAAMLRRMAGEAARNGILESGRPICA